MNLIHYGVWVLYDIKWVPVPVMLIVHSLTLVPREMENAYQLDNINFQDHAQCACSRCRRMLEIWRPKYKTKNDEKIYWKFISED